MNTLIVLPVPLLLVFATVAAAQEHPASSNMTCSEATSMVADLGAVVLTTGASRYERYVRSSEFCVQPENESPALVPTSNNPICFIGYTCGNQGPRNGQPAR
jgi:hypothetical protein